MSHLYALVGVTFIALSPIYVALASVSPVTAAFFRCFYAVPVLYLLRRRTGDGRTPRARRIGLASGLFLAADLVVWHEAIELIGAGLATVLANTHVVFVGLLAWLIHRERPKSAVFAVVPVVLTGVALIAGVGADNAFGEAPLLGALLGLGSGLLYSLFLLTFRRSNRELAPAPGPLLDATVGGALATLALGAVDPSFELRPHWPAHGWLLALAFGSQVAGWLLIAYTLPRLPALETSMMLLLQPSLAMILAAAVLRERISLAQTVGIVLVVGGVFLATIRGAVGPPPSEREDS